MKFTKIILSIWLLSTSILAQDSMHKESLEEENDVERLKAKGFFIGVDFENIDADTRYRVNSQNALFNIPNSSDKYNEPAFKLGYQYYYTRVYFKYSSLDEKTQDYTVESTSYELDVEYLPIFYRGDSYAIRGLLGTAIGYIDSDLKNLSARLMQEAEFVGLSDLSDKQPVYGVQIGLVFEMTNGLSAEFGYRYRRGNLLESDNGTDSVTFETKRRQLYLGFNYLF
jgi:opacity protein-like surface antigen